MARAAFFLIFLLLPAKAFASEPPISAGDITFFVENSYAGWQNLGNPDSFESRLYKIAKQKETPSSIVREFSRQLDISRRHGWLYARLLIDSVYHRVSCNGATEYITCDLSKDTTYTNQIKKIGFLDESGILLIDVAKNSAAGKNVTIFLATIDGHPALKSLILTLYGYRENHLFLLPLLEKEPLAIDAVFPAVTPRFAVYDSSFHLTLLQSLSLDLAGRPERNDEYLLVTINLVFTLLGKGLTEQALTTYLSLGSGQRKRIWDLLEHERGSSNVASYIARRTDKTLVIELAAALWSASLKEQARAHIGVYAGRLSRREYREHMLRRASDNVAFLREIDDPTLGDEELFQQLVYGRSIGEEPVQGDDGITSDGGWLWSLSKSAPVLRYLGERHLQATGHQKMAQYLAFHDLFHEHERLSPLEDPLINLLGNRWTTRKTEFDAKLSRVQKIHKRRWEAYTQSESRLANQSIERPAFFQERELPIEYRRTDDAEFEKQWRRDWDYELLENWEKLGLFVPFHAISHLREYGGRWYFVYNSRILDPESRYSEGGYWIARTKKNSTEWEPPQYLALQAYYPYYVIPASRLPLVDGEKIRMEVLIRDQKKNPATPPSQIKTSDQLDKIYLEFTWADLIRDTDQDGLSDVFEHRIGLDPGKRDTDEDGLSDGVDGFPTIPFDPSLSGSKELALVILNHIYKHIQLHMTSDSPLPLAISPDESIEGTQHTENMIGSHNSLFLRANHEILASVNIRHRMVVHTASDFDILDTVYGASMQHSIKGIFSNKSGTRTIVVWSGRYSLESFEVIRNDDGYVIIEISHWIS